MEELKELARFRRAVWILFQYEPISQKAFQGKYSKSIVSSQDTSVRSLNQSKDVIQGR